MAPVGPWIPISLSEFSRRMSHNRKVGLFVALTLFVIGGMILNFSKARGLFTPTHTIKIVAPKVGALKVGAPVALSGVRVGSVAAIELTEDRRAVEISIRILRKYPVHGDAKFVFEQSGLLGDEFVAIIPQDNAVAPLEHGSVVQAEMPFNLQEAAKSATTLLTKLDGAVEKIQGAVERVDRVLLTETTLTNLAETAVNFRKVSAEANETLGEVRKVVVQNSPTVSSTLSNLNAVTLRLDSVANQADQFMKDQKPSLAQTLNNANAASEDLKAITGDLREGRGPAGALLHDEGLRVQLASTLTNLATVSSNLARFGLLYKPPQPRKTLTNAVKYTGRDPMK